jgi:tetratricopeptide (TPR) repeat protein
MPHPLKWRRFILGFLIAVLAVPLWASDEKGCEGLGLNSRPASQYTPGALRKRIQQNPADVDALINLGTLEQERGNAPAAAALFDKAIQAGPGCSEGYYFAGLIHEQLGEKEQGISEADIRKALTLNPDLRTDGNIESYLARHQELWGKRPIAPTVEDPWRPTVILARANHFFIGFGVGLFLATVILRRVAQRTGGRPPG